MHSPRWHNKENIPPDAPPGGRTERTLQGLEGTALPPSQAASVRFLPPPPRRRPYRELDLLGDPSKSSSSGNVRSLVELEREQAKTTSHSSLSQTDADRAFQQKKDFIEMALSFNLIEEEIADKKTSRTTSTSRTTRTSSSLTGFYKPTASSGLQRLRVKHPVEQHLEKRDLTKKKQQQQQQQQQQGSSGVISPKATPLESNRINIMNKRNEDRSKAMKGSCLVNKSKSLPTHPIKKVKPQHAYMTMTGIERTEKDSLSVIPAGSTLLGCPGGGTSVSKATDTTTGTERTSRDLQSVTPVAAATAATGATAATAATGATGATGATAAALAESILDRPGGNTSSVISPLGIAGGSSGVVVGGTGLNGGVVDLLPDIDENDFPEANEDTIKCLKSRLLMNE